MAWPSKALLNGRSVCPKPTRIEATPPGRRGRGSLRLPPPAQTHFAALGRAVVCQRRVGRGRLKAQYDPENLFRMNYSVSGPQDRLLFMR
jgi:hypothetical protein